MFDSPALSGNFGWPHLIIILVAAQRLLEMLYANHNTRKLLAEGAKEVSGEHYIYIVGLHTLWLIAMFLFVPPSPPVLWGWLILFAMLQAARIWVIASLGKYWTTRIITMEQPLVSKGPYKFIRHPNYLVVALEIPILPLAFELYAVAALFGLGNLAILSIRIKHENEALDARR